MKLSHRFDPEEVARIWVYEPYCADCGSNDKCSVHHIYGSKGENNDSIFNGIMLCYNCHKKADGENIHQTGNKLRQKYLTITLSKVAQSDHKMQDRDRLFLKSVEKDLP
jgi:hypothetical protein